MHRYARSRRATQANRILRNISSGNGGHKLYQGAQQRGKEESSLCYSPPRFNALYAEEERVEGDTLVEEEDTEEATYEVCMFVTNDRFTTATAPYNDRRELPYRRCHTPA